MEFSITVGNSIVLWQRIRPDSTWIFFYRALIDLFSAVVEVVQKKLNFRNIKIERYFVMSAHKDLL